MIDVTTIKIRHPRQNVLLLRTVEGEAQAFNDVLVYLSSENPNLCKIMQEAIHDTCDYKLWRILLICLATHRLKVGLDSDRRKDPEASKRIDQSIIEVFIIDENELEVAEKGTVLGDALKNPDHKIRQTAAYLAGMRGDLRAVPILDETLRTGNEDWQLRAVKALAVLGDESCIPPLINALTKDRSKLHREARRALIGFGKLAEPAWIDLLKHPDSHIRWEAARGLGDIGNASAAYMLAEGLLDNNYAVRWATADVLTRLGDRAVPAVLKVISYRVLNEQSRQAVYHALHGIKSRETRSRLEPLLNALRSPTLDMQVYIIAQRLLAKWE